MSHGLSSAKMRVLNLEISVDMGETGLEEILWKKLVYPRKGFTPSLLSILMEWKAMNEFILKLMQ